MKLKMTTNATGEYVPVECKNQDVPIRVSPVRCQCAAGPWRYDIENAPNHKDLLLKLSDRFSLKICVGYFLDGGMMVIGREVSPKDTRIISFAEIKWEES